MNYIGLASAIGETLWQNKAAVALIGGVKLYEYAAAHPLVSAYLLYRGASAVYRRIYR